MPVRPHEGLVVEPGRQDRRNQAVDRAKIETDRRPAIDAAGSQAVIKQDARCQRIGHRAPARFKLHERIGFGEPAADDPARAVIFETAPDQPHAIGQQSCSKRIARVPRIVTPVERETHGWCIGARMSGKTIAGHSGGIACVAVSRTASNQRRHPNSCNQRSRKGPRGLS